jgi:hypothetical protein
LSASTLLGSQSTNASVTNVAALRLTVPKIASWWNFLRPLVHKALVRCDETTMMNVYDSLVSEALDCWIIITKEEQPKVVGLCIAGITVDLLVGYRNYLIYGLFSTTSIADSAWQSLASTVSEWARSNKCDRLVAFTDKDRVLEIAELIGGSASLVMIEKEL